MTVELPRFALGIKVPNPTFQFSDGSGGAAGWSPVASAGLTSVGMSDASEGGHGRFQRYSRANSGSTEIYSGYSPADLAVGEGSTQFIYPFRYRTPGNSGLGDYIALYHVFYDSAGDVINEQGIQSSSITGETADWTTIFLEKTLTAPAGVAYHGLKMTLGSSSAATYDVSFFGCGLHSASSAYYESTIYPEHPGIAAVLESIDEAPGALHSVTGRRFRLSRALNGKRFRLSLPFVHATEAEANAFNYLWAMNQGGNFEENDTNPTRGTYPILAMPRHDGLPTALYGDFETPQAPMVQGGERWYDPPVFDGTIELIEDVS